MKEIAIIGAGPGGLAAGLLLSKKYSVTIYEKDSMVGGRSKQLQLGDYRFDLGPTFLMYIEILAEVFSKSGYDLNKELNLIRLDPLYKLIFNDVTFTLSADENRNVEIYENYEKGMGKSYQKWLDDQEKKLNLIKPILEKPFSSSLNFFRSDVLKGIPVIHPFKSVYKLLSTYSKNPNFIHSLSFQAKYLGMASYQAPSIFTILPYLEHHKGLYHANGGLNQINHKMAELFQKNGGNLLLNQAVDEIIIEKKKIQGIRIGNDIKKYDQVILNADFSYAMEKLIDPKHLKKYHPIKLEKKKYSVSTFMLYLGLDKILDLEHHQIIFSTDYEKYLKELMTGEFSKDISLYIHNPSVIDSNLAPANHSSLYILVPVPNLRSYIDWDTYKKELRDQVISIINKKYQVDIEKHIMIEKAYTPKDWMNNENVYLGAVFNLSHGLDQMLHKRPHNHFEEVKNLYLVGGGTHPGSGLPTIYQSALILNDII